MNKPLRIIKILEGTSVDGPSLRTSLYLAGCRHQCPGCHNPHTWDFEAGEDMTVEEILEIIKENAFPVTLSGGDPVYQIDALLPLVQGISALGLKTWMYTGFTFEQLMEQAQFHSIAPYLEAIVDGPFVARLRDTSLLYRGSSNQRIIDVQASLRAGQAVTMTFDYSV